MGTEPNNSGIAGGMLGFGLKKITSV